MTGKVTDDDRSQLRLVALAQEDRVERNGAGQGATSSRSIGLFRASFESARSCASRVKRARRANRRARAG